MNPDFCGNCHNLEQYCTCETLSKPAALTQVMQKMDELISKVSEIQTQKPVKSWLKTKNIIAIVVLISYSAAAVAIAWWAIR